MTLLGSYKTRGDFIQQSMTINQEIVNRFIYFNKFLTQILYQPVK